MASQNEENPELECPLMDLRGLKDAKDGKVGQYRFKLSDYKGAFCLFLFCPGLVDNDDEAGVRRSALAEIETYSERLNEFTSKNCFVFAVVKEADDYNFEGFSGNQRHRRRKRLRLATSLGRHDERGSCKDHGEVTGMWKLQST